MSHEASGVEMPDVDCSPDSCNSRQ